MVQSRGLGQVKRLAPQSNLLRTYSQLRPGPYSEVLRRETQSADCSSDDSSSTLCVLDKQHVILAERPSSRVTIAGHAAHGVGTKGNRRYVFTEPLPSSGSELLLLRKCHGRAHLHSQYSRPIVMYITKCLNID